MNHKTTFSILVLSLSVYHVVAYGEGGDKRPGGAGGGDHGINRRITTKPDHFEAGGTFEVDFGLPVDTHGNEIAGQADNRPSAYLGGNGPAAAGGTFETDAGLQYDQGIGWNYFFRNTDPNTTGNTAYQYCQLSYWDGVSSRVWTSPTHATTDTMSFGISASGSLYLTAGNLGSQPAYWLGQSAEPHTPAKTTTIQTNPAAPVAAGDHEIILVSVANADASLEASEVLNVGGEPVQIGQIVGNKVTLGKDAGGNQLVFHAAHHTTDIVEQEVKFYVAYPDHLAAPWRGQAVVNVGVHGADAPRVKRVVAMTRRVPAGVAEDVLDGSWLTCLFSNGSIKDAIGGGTHDWGLEDGDVEQLGDHFTGFDAPVNNSPSDGEWDKIWNGHQTANSKTKVEFPELTTTYLGKALSGQEANIIARYGDDGDHDQRVASYAAKTGGDSRYKQERVVINLGVVTHLLGEKMK